jgi:sulfotransferase famil protein
VRASTQYKFCFISNPQCASSSIRFMLNGLSDIGSGKKFGPAGLGMKNHMSLPDSKNLLRELGENADDYFFFSSIRNPWDKMVSRFHYGLRNAGSVWHERAIKSGSFGAFIRDTSIQDAALNTEYRALFCENGSYALNDIIKVENFDTDIGRIWNALSLPKVRMRHTNKNSDRTANYRKYYDDESIEIVRRIFDKEIERFEYAF